MITTISGLPRVGKTALATMFAVEHLTDKAPEDIARCKRELKKMNKSGFNYPIPKKHLVFSNYFIESKKPDAPLRRSYDIDGFKFALPNPDFPTSFEPPYSFIVFDEAQRYYNSRKKGLSPYVCRKFETHGHHKLNVILVSPRLIMIDANIRANAERCIEVLDLRHKYDRNGRIVKSVWRCLEFGSCYDAEAYKETGAVKNGKEVYFDFAGDIFACYNSFNFSALHYKDNYTRGFDMKDAVNAGLSLQSVQKFNDTHGLNIPRGFFKE